TPSWWLPASRARPYVPKGSWCSSLHIVGGWRRKQLHLPGIHRPSTDVWLLGVTGATLNFGQAPKKPDNTVSLSPEEGASHTGPRQTSRSSGASPARRSRT